jgi:hypothetical protein
MVELPGRNFSLPRHKSEPRRRRSWLDAAMSVQRARMCSVRSGVYDVIPRHCMDASRGVESVSKTRVVQRRSVAGPLVPLQPLQRARVRVRARARRLREENAPELSVPRHSGDPLGGRSAVTCSRFSPNTAVGTSFCVTSRSAACERPYECQASQSANSDACPSPTFGTCHA